MTSISNTPDVYSKTRSHRRRRGLEAEGEDDGNGDELESLTTDL
jgi:hypothetical protein